MKEPIERRAADAEATGTVATPLEDGSADPSLETRLTHLEEDLQDLAQFSEYSINTLKHYVDNQQELESELRQQLNDSVDLLEEKASQTEEELHNIHEEMQKMNETIKNNAQNHENLHELLIIAGNEARNDNSRVDGYVLDLEDRVNDIVERLKKLEDNQKERQLHQSAGVPQTTE